MKEVWRDIKGYEGRYSISNFGRIKTLKRYNVPKDKIKKVAISKTGYNFTTFFNKNKRVNFYVHRLVAIHFIKNDKNKPCVNHKDGDKLNNRADNLEWCTYKENTVHAYKNGLLYKPSSKLNDKEVIDILKLKKFFTITELSKIFNVSYNAIWYIVNNKTWKNIKNKIGGSI